MPAFRRRVFGAALTLALAANAIPSEILPPDQLVAGKSYAEWKAIGATRVHEIPWDDLHPWRDRTGANALRNQSGPVWFLVQANTTVPVVRFISVPDDIILHFALAGAACSTVEPPPYFGRDEEELRACAQGHSLDWSDWSCEVDGVSLANPADYVTTSTLFDFVLPEPNILGLPGGTEGQGVAHGAAVMTRFLPGNHTVHFRSNFPEIGFSNDVTFAITVYTRPTLSIQPCPESGWVKLSWLAGNGFILQETDRLDPGAIWTPAAVIFRDLLGDTEISWVENIPPGSRFFRLYRP